MTTPDSTARSDSVPQAPMTAPEPVLQGGDIGRVELPMDHPLVKALHRDVRRKQEERERLERKHYVDPRDIRFVMGGR